MTNKRRRESNTQLIRTFPPRMSPLLRPQKCGLLVEDRRVDPLFYPFCALSLSFFRVSPIRLSHNACSDQVHFGGEVRFSSDRQKPSILFYYIHMDRSKKDLAYSVYFLL